MDATTAEIARRAGSSEGTLFKRFQSKWGLFHAVMEKAHDGGRTWTSRLSERVGRRTIAEELEEAANEGIDFFRLVVPLHMLSGLSTEHTKMLTRHWSEHHPALEARRRMEGYFEAERRLGRIRRVDVEVTARIFQGTLYNFAVSELLTGPYEPSPLPQEKFVRHFVETLLSGISPVAQASTVTAVAAKRPPLRVAPTRARIKKS